MDETNHTASVFTKEIWLYINFVKIADSKIPCKLFAPTSKSFQSYHAWYEEGGLNMEVGYSCKRKWEWEYIKNYYYSMTISTKIDQQYWMTVVPCCKECWKQCLWQHYAATNRAKVESYMIPPFKVSKGGVQTDYALGQTKRPASKSLDKND